jgi:2-keto-4-pentenoate hydratase/2-oxohepta-3-ene-1,7-dioic acid hydratase in catechol pathway
MKLVRFARGSGDGWGEVVGETVKELWGDLYDPGHPTGREFALEELKILAPTRPRKLFIIARNYADHAREMSSELPIAPVFVCVSPEAALAHQEDILIPKDAERIDYEAELVAIIGRRTKNIREADALEAVAGYTCGLDISHRDIQRGPLKNISAAKGWDTFKPFGPFVETGLDPQNLEIILRQNGEEKQHGHTRDMVFPVARLIHDISTCMTLEPGDVIFTGTPSGVGSIADGDHLEVEIEQIGTLKNRVMAIP